MAPMTKFKPMYSNVKGETQLQSLEERMELFSKHVLPTSKKDVKISVSDDSAASCRTTIIKSYFTGEEMPQIRAYSQGMVTMLGFL